MILKRKHYLLSTLGNVPQLSTQKSLPAGKIPVDFCSGTLEKFKLGKDFRTDLRTKKLFPEHPKKGNTHDSDYAYIHTQTREFRPWVLEVQVHIFLGSSTTVL